MAKIFIYLFTAMLHDVTITSLLCLYIICYKTDVPTGRLIRELEQILLPPMVVSLKLHQLDLLWIGCTTCCKTNPQQIEMMEFEHIGILL